MTREPKTRSQEVKLAIGRIKEIAGEREIDRPTLDRILAVVKELADKSEYWNAEEFPPPDLPEKQARYVISEESDHSFTLYLNVFRPGKPIPPHNHTTWACIAAVEGSEHNYLYHRTDDGKTEGVGTLVKTGEIVVSPGHGIALMPEDIHRVEIRGDQPIRHLHMYGRALEVLSERVMFELDAGRVKRMGVGVASRRLPSVG